MPKSRSGIPDRWEAYSKMGKVIPGTSIMPIKTPLRESITSTSAQEERFSPASLIDLMKKEKLKLGGVVDLTNTSRYYDSQSFTEHGIGYRKINTAGRVVPNDMTYNTFTSAIKELEKEGEVTCVHCTHGLNRSGYLICRYMIEVLEVEPQKAIKLFEDARGYKMERPNYIDDLMRRTPGDAGTAYYYYQSQENPSNQQNFSTYQNYGGNQAAGCGRHDSRNDWNWNSHNGHREQGYSSHNTTWNRDGPRYNNFTAGYRHNDHTGDRRSGGCGGRGGGHGSGRHEGWNRRTRWEEGPSHSRRNYETDYVYRNGGGSFKSRQSQSSEGKWQSHDYASSKQMSRDNGFGTRGGHSRQAGSFDGRNETRSKLYGDRLNSHVIFDD